MSKQMKILLILTGLCMYFQVEAGNNSVLELKYLVSKVSQSASDVRKTVKVGKVNTLPLMDGRLNDSAWKSAGEIDSFVVMNSRGKTLAAVKTRVKFLFP